MWSPYLATAIEAARALTLLWRRTWDSSCSMYSAGRFAEVAVWMLMSANAQSSHRKDYDH
jgi:hypothetical protein